jgi:carboxymethylenebutenolidase
MSRAGWRSRTSSHSPRRAHHRGWISRRWKKAAQLFSQLDRGKVTEDFLAAAEWLKRAGFHGQVGAVAAASVAASSIFWPCGWALISRRCALRKSAECTADAANHAPLLAHTGSLPGSRQGWPAFDKEAHRRARHASRYVCAGANHGFHNDTTPRYDEPAAKLAWQRTLDWFNKYLR